MHCCTTDTAWLHLFCTWCRFHDKTPPTPSIPRTSVFLSRKLCRSANTDATSYETFCIFFYSVAVSLQVRRSLLCSPTLTVTYYLYLLLWLSRSLMATVFYLLPLHWLLTHQRTHLLVACTLVRSSFSWHSVDARCKTRDNGSIS